MKGEENINKIVKHKAECGVHNLMLVYSHIILEVAKWMSSKFKYIHLKITHPMKWPNQKKEKKKKKKRKKEMARFVY